MGKNNNMQQQNSNYRWKQQAGRTQQFRQKPEKNPQYKAKLEYKKNALNKKKTAEIEKRNEEKKQREQMRAQSKVKRLEKTKVVSKKTKKGQPLMKDRIEFLLKQIQEMKK